MNDDKFYRESGAMIPEIWMCSKNANFAFMLD